MEPTETTTVPKRHRRWYHPKYLVAIVCTVLGAWLLVAYVVLPLGWQEYAQRHPGLDNVSGVTLTKNGIPGDPLNVALVGDEARVKAVMQAAGWNVADPLGFRSDVKIAADTVLHRSYADAPVSNLYLFGRKEDLAFEQPVGNDPRRRHHVRFWRAEKTDSAGRPLFLGAVTFDQRVGLSHDTGQITHHIAPDVDTERDHLMRTLADTGSVADTCYVDDFHKIRAGHNGGGDPWHTDGRLAVATLTEPP